MDTGLLMLNPSETSLVSSVVETENPYQAPAGLLIAPPREGQPRDRAPRDNFVFVTWTVVFGLNLIIPVLLGWPLTEEHGRLGVCVAIVLFLVAGWALCYARPSAARKLVIGSLITGASQLFPLLHIFLGMIALAMVEHFELAEIDEFAPFSRIVSELGGFLASLVVGSGLLVCAGGIGLMLSLLQRLRRREPAAARNGSDTTLAT